MARNLSGLVWEVDYPPLHSYYYWHGWYLPYGWWFLKVFLLCKLVIPLPCAQTCCMFPCRYLLQITILSGSTVSPSHWERNAEGSCWVIQVPSSWNNSKRKILVNSYLVPLVVQWIYLIGGAKVFALLGAWRASYSRGHLLCKSNWLNPPESASSGYFCPVVLADQFVKISHCLST